VAAGSSAVAALDATAAFGPEGEWRVSGDDLELSVSAVHAEHDGLARVQGRFTAGGDQHAVDGLGWRRSAPGLLEQDWATLDQVATWFADDYGLSLTSLRPTATGRHSDATITAEVLGDELGAAEDPRLSTTYRPTGEIVRAGIELWLARGEEDELYPLRASGEAVGPRLDLAVDGITLVVDPFRWHSRDREGAGIFLRGRR
jgi:hypothetical protein